MSTFSDYAALRSQQGLLPNPDVDPVTGQYKPALPVIDTSNAIGSLAELLGPTPAEREAQELRRQQGKAKMQMWAGLFDGLRQLGNLYAATKGATPQRYTDNPYQQVEQMADAQRQREDALINYGRQYYASLYNMQRQLNDDKRRNLLAEAQANYYNTRDDMARQKAELDKLKAVRVIKMQDGSLMKFDPISGAAEPLSEADPLYVEYKRSQINKNNRTGTGGGGSRNNGTYGYEKRKWVDDNGVWHEERVPTTGTKPGPVQPQQPKEPKQPSSRGKGKGNTKSGTNRSGFFNK